MKKTVSAVKYGLETLGVTPDKLFSLIESSKGFELDLLNGYTQEDYGRWLAGKIVEVAEADGVGFSQLLVKKFNILSDLVEMNNLQVSDTYLKIFSKKLGYSLEEIYSYGLLNDTLSDEKRMDDYDWMTGIDYDRENSFFTEELPYDDLKEKLKKGVFPFLFKLGKGSPLKKSDISVDAKSRGVSLGSFDAALLYRMCLLYDTYGSEDSKFGFLCPTEFLVSTESISIVSEVLERFNVSGYYMSDLNPYYGEYAFCVCSGRGLKERTEYIMLSKCSLTEGGSLFNNDLSKNKVFSHSKKKMISYLRSNSIYNDDMSLVVKNEKAIGYGYGNKSALGYLCVGNRLVLRSAVCTTKDEKDTVCIPITEDNLYDVIAYYGANKSNEGNGYFTDINVLVSGSSKYDEMVYNSLPLFLFDYDSCFKDYTFKDKDGVVIEVKNYFNLVNSDLVKRLLKEGESYYTFEAKELLDVCKAYLTGIDNLSMSFEELRISSSDDRLDSIYRNSVRRLKEYISSAYRSVM